MAFVTAAARLRAAVFGNFGFARRNSTQEIGRKAAEAMPLSWLAQEPVGRRTYVAWMWLPLSVSLSLFLSFTRCAFYPSVCVSPLLRTHIGRERGSGGGQSVFLSLLHMERRSVSGPYTVCFQIIGNLETMHD